MNRLLEQTYRRLGPRYLRAFVLFYLSVSATLCLIANLIFTLFVETSTALFFSTLAVSMACLLLAMLHGARAWLRAAAPITDWLAAGRPAEGAASAWRTAIDAPKLGVQMQAWRSVLFTAIPLTGYIGVAYELPIATALLFAIGLLAAATYPTLLFFLFTEQVMRPVVVDAALIGSLAEPAPVGISLRAKLLMALPLMGVVTSGFTNVVLTASNHGTLEDLGMSIVVSIGVTATAGFVLTLMLAESITGPVDELLEATQLVAGGDLEARAPILGGDEIGRLSESFNAMIGAVAEREELRDRAMKAEAEAERAVAEERARIARELHDSVSHSMTLVVLQARAGEVMLDEDPERARAALRQIEETGRSALGELRRFLGILRAPGEGAALTPAPRLSSLAEVCDRLERAGVRIHAELPAATAGWPSDLELAAFRIGQEALTNVLKHAGATNVRLAIAERDGIVEIEVVDDGHGAGIGSGRFGHGLVGMRERAAVYGGSVETGPGPGGRGFAVRATLPLAERVSPQS